MSSIKARGVLKRWGLDEEAFAALHRVSFQHADKRGGQHTNGGCSDGRCDYGSPTCAAWTRLCAIIARNLPDPPPAPHGGEK